MFGQNVVYFKVQRKKSILHTGIKLPSLTVSWDIYTEALCAPHLTDTGSPRALPQGSVGAGREWPPCRSSGNAQVSVTSYLVFPCQGPAQGGT